MRMWLKPTTIVRVDCTLGLRSLTLVAFIVRGFGTVALAVCRFWHVTAVVTI